MNQTQVKYARARAAAILTARKAAVTEKHTTPAVRLSNDQKRLAIDVGAFRWNADKQEAHHNWYSGIVFDVERPAYVDQKAIDEEHGQLIEAYRKLEDELVLGDNDAALALLRAFEAGA
jgi:hypothetical protein